MGGSWQIQDPEGIVRSSIRTVSDAASGWAGLRLEPELAPLVPHGVVSRSAGGRGPGHAGEGPGVDADVRHLLLQSSQVAGVHHPKHVQEAQEGEHLAHVAARQTGSAR